MTKQNTPQPPLPAPAPVKQKSALRAVSRLLLGFFLCLIFGSIFLNGEGNGALYGLVLLIPSATIFVIGTKDFLEILER